VKYSRAWPIALIFVLGVLLLPKYLDQNAPDLKVFYTAGQWALSDPAKIYHDSPDLFLYPPQAALGFSILQILPSWEWAKAIWYLFMLALILRLAWGSWASLLASLLITRYFLINLTYGQVNLLVLSLMVLGFEWIKNKRPWPAGFLLASTIFLKVFPIMTLVPLISRKNFRVLGTTLLFLGLGLALPLVVWKMDLATRLMFVDFPQQLQLKGVPLYSHNQSILAFLRRLFGGDPFDLFSAGSTDWTLLRLPPLLITAASTVLGLGLAGLGFWKARVRQGPGDDLSAACFAILFISHLVWKPYFIFLYPPLLLLAKDATHKWPNKFFSFWTLAVYGALAFGSAPDFLGLRTGAVFDGLCIHLWAAILIFVAWWNIKNNATQIPVKNP